MSGVRGIGIAWIFVLAGMTPGQTERGEIAALIRQLRDDAGWERAARALVEVGAPAARPLGRALLPGAAAEPTDLSFYERILTVLSRMGEDGAGATEYLAKALPRYPSSLTSMLYRALGDIGPWARVDERVFDISCDGDRLRIGGVLVPGPLDDGFESLILNVTRARARLGLDEILEWERMSVMPPRYLLAYAFQAEWVMDRLPEGTAHPSDAVPRLLSILRQGYPLQVTFSLPGFPGREATTDLDALIHLAAARALIRLIPRDKLCLTAYAFQLQHHPDVEFRVQAAVSMQQFTPMTTEVLDDVMRALDDPEPRVVREAVTLLGMMGLGARRAAEKLEKLTRHPDSQIAARARAALRAIR